MPEVSRVAESTAPADDRLTPAEVAEMRGHLAFLRSYKDLLRLKLNAAEDLLVNGHREPSDRGVCRHLLAKIDRTAIEGAITREPLCSDVAARARMLGGALRVTADVSVLLDYLETLAHVRSHAEAAAAFAEAVARLDFAAVSAARFARLLQVLVDTFADHERVQVLFGLLGMPAFCRAFDAAAGSFSPAVLAACAPLRAVHRRLLEDRSVVESTDLLATGIAQVLSAPDPVLRGYPEALRTGVLQLALDLPGVPPELADRAAGVLLASLPRSDRTYARLAIRRGAQLLRGHADDRARAVLEELRRAHPDQRLAERWLAALAARHLGRVALTGVGPPARGRLQQAFWLDGPRAVWLRTAAAADADRLAGEAGLQAGLALPCVAPVVEHGVASGIPYVAIAAPGQPLSLAGPTPLDAGMRLGLAGAAARVLRALALVGVALPDAEPERFLHVPALAPMLLLADLDGAERVDAATAAARHATHACALARRLVPGGAVAGLPTATATALAQALGGVPELTALIGVLDDAAVHATYE